MWLQTGLDLKADALALAGEPGDGTSEYDSDVYTWLTVVQRALVSGGQFGPSLLEPIEWGWARAWPRGAIQLQQPFNRAMTVDATFLTGSVGVTVAGATFAPSTNLAGWRIVEPGTAARHLIRLSAGNNISLWEPWTGESMTTDAWWAYPDTYELPLDFVRGTSPLYIAGADMLVGPSQIDLIDPADLERLYPHGGSMGGMPECAARVTDTRIRFSHYLDTPSVPRNVQVEFEYIRRLPMVTEGSIPRIPVEHRRILSYGAAYLIMADKDDSGATALWQQFQAQYKAMREEEVRSARRMSSRWGVIQPPRASGRQDLAHGERLTGVRLVMGTPPTPPNGRLTMLERATELIVKVGVPTALAAVLIWFLLFRIIQALDTAKAGQQEILHQIEQRCCCKGP